MTATFTSGTPAVSETLLLRCYPIGTRTDRIMVLYWVSMPLVLKNAAITMLLSEWEAKLLNAIPWMPGRRMRWRMCMRCKPRQQEGVTFLTDTRSDWSQAQALSIHNGWHLALFLIELERGDEVLKYYDRFVAPRLEEDSLLDLVDASSLLWRLELAEVKVGSHRWEHLA